MSVLMVIGAEILRPRTVPEGSPSDEVGGFFASQPAIVAIAIAVVGVILLVL